MAKLILYQAKSPYPGDVTKNCALTGKEVDNNFLNLKGEDIEKIYFDEETKKITFTRFKDGLKNCNGETIEAKIEVDLTKLEYVVGYKYEDGLIKILYSTGKTVEMPIEAFGMAVATDSTISGNGSTSKPLSISQAIRTGQYQPVNGIIDSVNGEKLPETKTNGVGYVTREVKSDFGLFYNSSQAILLNEILRHENSEWRVPSKKDWDVLLNYLEDCDRYKNHSLRSETPADALGMKLGNIAGFKAKSRDTDDANYWAEGGDYNGDVMRIYPAGSFSALTGRYSGFGFHGHLWTLTKGDICCRNMYSKKFEDCKGTVTQIEEIPEAKLSIRLVKNFIGDNYHQFEEIHGRLYETKLFVSEENDCNLIWTMVNVDISDPQYGLEPTPMPEDATTAITSDIAYYINRWDGKHWQKHEMTEGDCVVIVDDEKGYDDASRVDEYRLERDSDGKLHLVNMDEFWQDQIDSIASSTTDVTKIIEEIRSDISELSGTTDELRNDVDELSGATDEIKSNIEDLSGSTQELREDLDELSGITEGIMDDVEELSGATADLRNDVDELSGKTEGIREDLDELSGSTQELREDLDELSGKTDDIREDLDELSGITEGIMDDVEELSGKTEGVREDLDELSGKTEGIMEDVEELSGTTADLRNDIDELSGTTEGIKEEIDEIKETVDEVSGATQEMKEEVEKMSDDVEQLKTDVENFNTALSEEIENRETGDNNIWLGIGTINDIPAKQLPDGRWSNSASDFEPSDFENGDITVFGYINSLNDYGYNEED